MATTGGDDAAGVGSVVHAVPSSVDDSQYGAGNWKAVEATRQALDDARVDARHVVFDWRDPTTLLPQLGGCRDVLIEYSHFPSLLEEIRARDADVRLHVRTLNAEAYQHLHRAAGGSRREYASRELWRRALFLARQDAHCRRVATTLLGISPWDDAHYWRWLPGRAAVQHLPYHSPWPALRPQVQPAPWDRRRPAIVSMGGNFDPSGMANVVNFEKLARAVAAEAPDSWTFLLTWWAEWHDAVPDVSPAIEIVRDCREPWDLLCEVRALAVLTPFGFGLKTTVVDGLAAGCHVIVHRKLAPRLPEDVRARCIVWDPDDAGQGATLSARLAAPPPDDDINDRLREEAARVCRSAFARVHA